MMNSCAIISALANALQLFEHPTAQGSWFAIECALHCHNLCACKGLTALRSSIAAWKTHKNSVKGHIWIFFFWQSMTSEVKDYFYKLVDILINYMHKKFCNDIWTGSCVRRFQSYKLILKFFRPFNDLWDICTKNDILNSFLVMSYTHKHKIYI